MHTLSRPGEWMMIGHEGRRPWLAFDGVPEGWRPPRWPDPAAPQQMHLDIGIEDRATLARAERLGAIRPPAVGGGCPVYADPSGHPICLCLPGE